MKLRKIKLKKKAQMPSFNIFTFMIASFIAVVMFAGMIWIMGTLNDVFMEVGLDNEKNANDSMYVNITQATVDIWGQQAQAIQALRMVSTVYILALGAVIIITGFLERKYPFLFFVYILIILLAVIFAPTISNAYEDLLAEGLFDGELTNFSASNFLLLNLPAIVLIVGGLGGIGLFINLVRGGGEHSL